MLAAICSTADSQLAVAGGLVSEDIIRKIFGEKIRGVFLGSFGDFIDRFCCNTIGVGSRGSSLSIRV